VINTALQLSDAITALTIVRSYVQQCRAFPARVPRAQTQVVAGTPCSWGQAGAFAGVSGMDKFTVGVTTGYYSFTWISPLLLAFQHVFIISH
jgi:hypothetical protein